MLQFLTTDSNKYSIAEEAQMAIEGGCRWIQVTESLPDGVTQKDAVNEIRQLCEENEAFLMVDSDVELANEMRIHGVHLKKGGMKPIEAREMLGAHAVIGVDADNAGDILALQGQDIDYAALDFGKLTLDEIAGIVRDVRKEGMDIHIVARGVFSTDDLHNLQKAGISGFAVSAQITDAADPVKATADILNAIQ